MENLNTEHVRGRHVLIIEDIYDTGRSMKELLIYLRTLGPHSLRTAIMLHKCNLANLEYNYVADFVGYAPAQHKEWVDS